MKEDKYCDITLEDFLKHNTDESLYFSEYLPYIRDKKKFLCLCKKAFCLDNGFVKTKGLHSSVRYFINNFRNFCKYELLKNSQEVYQVLCWQEWQETLFCIGKFLNDKNSNFSEKDKCEVLIELLFISGKIFKSYKEKEVNDFHSVFNFNQKVSFYRGVILNTVKNHLYKIWQIVNQTKEE